MKNNICTHIPTFHLKTVRLIFSCTLGRRSWPYDLHSIKSSRESEWGEQGWFCREVTSTTSTRDIKIFSISWKTKQQNNETQRTQKDRLLRVFMSKRWICLPHKLFLFLFFWTWYLLIAVCLILLRLGIV